jgi:hypothetical protein
MTSGGFPVRRGPDAGQLVAYSYEKTHVAVGLQCDTGSCRESYACDSRRTFPHLAEGERRGSAARQTKPDVAEVGGVARAGSQARHDLQGRARHAGRSSRLGGLPDDRRDRPGRGEEVRHLPLLDERELHPITGPRRPPPGRGQRRRGVAGPCSTASPRLQASSRASATSPSCTPRRRGWATSSSTRSPDRERSLSIPPHP